MATAAAVEAKDAEAVTKTDDKWVWVNASSDTDDASEHFEPSIHESPSASDVRSDTITLASRQQLEHRDGLIGSADTKIPSNADVASRCGACIIIVSLLFVLSSTLLLHQLYSEPLALLWAIAAFISAYIIFLIFIFSPVMCLSTVFFRMLCPVLLAIVADRFVGPLGGFLVMHMATGWLAGVLGYAYGQLLQHIGRMAEHINPSALTEEEKRTFKEARGPAAAGFGLLSLLMVTTGALPLWFIPEDLLCVYVAFLYVMEGGAVLCWVAFVARFVLLDALLSVGQLGYITLCYISPNVLIGFILLFVLELSNFYFTTDAIGATYLWCLMLFIAGLLGYELSVHAHCKQMMLPRRVLELRDDLSSAAGESPTAATTSDEHTRSADD